MSERGEQQTSSVENYENSSGKNDNIRRSAALEKWSHSISHEKSFGVSSALAYMTVGTVPLAFVPRDRNSDRSSSWNKWMLCLPKFECAVRCDWRKHICDKGPFVFRMFWKQTLTLINEHDETPVSGHTIWFSFFLSWSKFQIPRQIIFSVIFAISLAPTYSLWTIRKNYWSSP